MKEEYYKYPVVADNFGDPFENFVALYYRLKGYICETRKWFSVNNHWKDIDVLAIGSEDLHIIACRQTFTDSKAEVIGHRSCTKRTIPIGFKDTLGYITGVKEYKSFIDSREIFLEAAGIRIWKDRTKYEKEFRKNVKKEIGGVNGVEIKDENIKFLSFDEILSDILKHINEHKVNRTSDPNLWLLQKLADRGKIKD